MNVIQKLWNGEYSLPKTYWGFSVFGNVVFAISFIFIDPIKAPLLYVCISTLALIYAIFVTIAIWRSASKYQGAKIWEILAKAACVLSMAVGVISFVSLFGAFNLSDASKHAGTPQLIEPCRIYWNGKEFKFGSANDSKDFTSLKYGKYGVTGIIIGFPNEMLETFGYKKDISADAKGGYAFESNPEYQAFFKENFSKAEALCGFR